MLPSILPIENKEITKILESSLKKSGIDILTNTKVEGVKIDHEVTVTVSDKDGKRKIKADIALMAVGVQANIENLGLEAVGVKSERGFIPVNECWKNQYRWNLRYWRCIWSSTVSPRRVARRYCRCQPYCGQSQARNR